MDKRTWCHRTDREGETLEREDGERHLEREDGERHFSGVNRVDSGPDGCGFLSRAIRPEGAGHGHPEGPASANSARGSQGDGGRPRPSVPDDVVAVAPVELLPVLPRAVHHADARHEVHDLLGRRVVEVVAALVAPVAVHPLEPQVAARGAPGRHVGAPTPPFRSGPRRRRRETGGGGVRAKQALPRAAGTRRLPRPLSRAWQVHVASPAAAGVASAHGREENPSLAEHAEGRGRRRPSRGCRAPSLRPPRSPCLLRPQRPSLEPSRARARLPPPRLRRRPGTQLLARVTCGVHVPPRSRPTARRTRAARPPAQENGERAASRGSAPSPPSQPTPALALPNPAPPLPAGEREGSGCSLGTVAGSRFPSSRSRLTSSPSILGQDQRPQPP